MFEIAEVEGGRETRTVAEVFCCSLQRAFVETHCATIRSSYLYEVFYRNDDAAIALRPRIAVDTWCNPY